MTSDETTPLGFSATEGDGWHLDHPGGKVLTVVAVATGAVSIAFAVRTAAQGDWLPAVTVFLFALAVLLKPWSPTAARSAPRDYEGPLGAGLALPIHPVRWRSIGSLSLFAVLCFTGLGTALYRLGDVDDPLGTVAATVVVGLLGAFFALGAYGGVRSQLTNDRCLLLTVDGLVIGGVRTPVRVRWHDVRGLRRHWTVTRRRGLLHHNDLVHNWLSFDVVPGAVEGKTPTSTLARTEEPTIDVATLAVDPRVVVAVVTFYLDNPEARGELRTVEAVDRAAEIARALGAETAR